MTYIEREEIFSKDYLTIEDVGKLLGLKYNEAAKQIRDIKKGLELSGKRLRLTAQGRLHVQDYLDYYNLSAERYGGGIHSTQERSSFGRYDKERIGEVVV